MFLVVCAAPLAACGGSAPPAASSGGPPRGATASLLHRVRRRSWRTSRWSPVATATWATTVRTTGTVDWDDDQTTQAITQVGGPITRIARRHRHGVHGGRPAAVRRQPRRGRRRLGVPQGEEPASTWPRRTRDREPRPAGAQGHRPARPRVGSRPDSNDAVDGRHAERTQALEILGLTPTDLDAAERAERADPARAGDARADRRHGRPASWCCPDRSSRPARPSRSSSATCRPSGCRATSTRATWPRCTSATRSTCARAAFPEVFHGVVTYIGERDRSRRRERRRSGS